MPTVDVIIKGFIKCKRITNYKRPKSRSTRNAFSQYPSNRKIEKKGRFTFWINEVFLVPYTLKYGIGCDFRRMREFPFALTTLCYTEGP